MADAAHVSTQEITGSSISSSTVTPGSGSERMLEAKVGAYASNVGAITGITFKGVAFTKVRREVATTEASTEVWLLLESVCDASAGAGSFDSSGTLAVTFASGSPTSEECLHLATFSGMKQSAGVLFASAGVTAATGSGSAESASVASDSHGIVSGMVTTFSTTNITATSPGTERAELQNGTNLMDHESQTSAGTGSSVTMAWGGMTDASDRTAVVTSYLGSSSPDYPTILGHAHDPVTDNSANAGTDAAVDKDAGALSTAVTGDVIVAIVCYRGTSGTLSVTTTGGQTWNQSGSQINTGNFRCAMFWCIFNGTWSADPVFSISSGTNAILADCIVIGKDTFDSTTPFDVAFTSNGTSSSSTFDQTGFNTATDGALAFIGRISQDNNTYGSFTAGWSTVWDQWRVTTTTGLASVLAYKPMATAGGTGNFSSTQATLGADASFGFYFAIKPAAASSPQTLDGGAIAAPMTVASGAFSAGGVSLAGAAVIAAMAVQAGAIESVISLDGSAVAATPAVQNGAFQVGGASLLGGAVAAAPAVASGALQAGGVSLPGSAVAAPPAVQEGSLVVGGVVLGGSAIDAGPSVASGELTTAAGAQSLAGSAIDAGPVVAAGAFAAGGAAIAGGAVAAALTVQEGALVAGGLSLGGSAVPASPSVAAGSLVAGGALLAGGAIAWTPEVQPGSLDVGGAALEGSAVPSAPSVPGGSFTAGGSSIAGTSIESLFLVASGDLASPEPGALATGTPALLPLATGAPGFAALLTATPSARVLPAATALPAIVPASTGAPAVYAATTGTVQLYEGE